MSIKIRMILLGRVHDIQWMSVLRGPEWNGEADVHPFDEDGKQINWGYTCSSMERALEVKEELLKKYPKVVVRDNATRKEKIFRRKIEEKE